MTNIPEITPDDNEIIMCPITNEEATTMITIYKWKWYLIMIKMEKAKVPVSENGKRLHNSYKSTFWSILTPIINFMLYIPLIGGILSVVAIILVSMYGLVLCIILDLIMKENVLGRGILQLIDGEIVKHEYNNVKKTTI